MQVDFDLTAICLATIQSYNDPEENDVVMGQESDSEEVTPTEHMW